jgi:hypothetical protein
MKKAIILALLLSVTFPSFAYADEKSESVCAFIKNYQPYVNCENTIYEICVLYTHKLFYTFKFKDFTYTEENSKCLVTATFIVSKPREDYLAKSDPFEREQIESIKDELQISWIVDAGNQVKPYNFFAQDALKIFKQDFKAGCDIDLQKK